MRQLTIKLDLLEYDTVDFPMIVVPKCLFKGRQYFMGDDVEPAILAAKHLANCMGMETEDVEESK